VDYSRRNLLRGLLNPGIWTQYRNRVPLPYVRDPDAACRGCAACVDSPCVDACGRKIIGLDRDGLPGLDFSGDGCTFCGDCAAVCGPEVLDVTIGPPIAAEIELDRQLCVAWGRGICNDCVEPCPEDAILMVGLMHPRVIEDRCTRCGLCVPACPQGAIRIRPKLTGGHP